MTALHAGSLSMTERADWIPGPPQGSWTYEAYLQIPDDGHRYEIIDGVLYRMDAPSVPHQGTVVRFTFHFVTHVEVPGLGRVFCAPCDVELPLTPTVKIQPDVFVILNANLGIIDFSHILGAPDLIVEVASPGTVSNDRHDKRNAYERAGVQEYWLADPRDQTIEVLLLVNGQYRTMGVFQGAVTLPSRVLHGLPVTAQQFFV